MSQDDSQATFDEWAEDYDTALAHGIRVSGEGKDYFAQNRLSFLADCLAAEGLSPSRVLDFGCGTGSAAPYFFGELQCISLLGVDVSPRSIAHARRENKDESVSFEVLDEFAPPGDIDVAYASGVFHHVVPPERIAIAEKVLQSLRPGGLFALWDNNPWNPGARYVMSKIPFDRDAIMLSVREARQLLLDAGFEIVRSDFLFIFPAVLSWLRFLERPLSKLPIGAQYQVLARKPLV
jgi:SAM-dependent methyltransferase